MKVEGDELVTAAEIGRRLRLSPQRIRQLAHEGRLPPAVGHSGRNTLWSWASIQDWATATGRLESRDRPPSQAWKGYRGKRERFQRSIDCIIKWGFRSSVHVRMWSPVDRRLRPVVLLGELDDNQGQSVTNGIELAAMTVAARLIGNGGLHADWYEYWPDRNGLDHNFHAVTFTVVGAGESIRGRHARWRRRVQQLGGELRDPQWSDIAREALEDLVGEEIEVYPSGAYSSDNVTRFALEGVFPLMCDPTGLKSDIEAARALLEYKHLDLERDSGILVSFLLSRDFDERARKNRASARNQARGLAVKPVPYSPAPEEVAWLRSPDLSRDALEKDLRSERDLVRHQQRLRRWLVRNGTEADQLLLVPGSQGLAWLDHWQVGLDEEAFSAESATATAVRRAEQRLAEKRFELVASDPDDDFPLLVPSEYLDATGRWARKYLDTVSWWGPSTEDVLRAKRLATQLESDRSYVSGYDPWGRLVLKQGKAFVVEWPLGPMSSPPPDDALIVGNASAKAYAPVFILLPDSRLDLLPGSISDRGDTAFTWGYSGGGPAALTEAVCQLLGVTSVGRNARAEITQIVVECRTTEFKASFGHLRSLISNSASSRTGRT